MSVPRVAVVGGGISGTLCSLVLRNRGLNPILIDQGREVGGRLRGSDRSNYDVDAGAQFLRASSHRLLTVFRMLESSGLLARWNGRFGLLGSQNGGFLPSSIVGTTAVGGMMKNNNDNPDETTENLITDAGDFCGFVTHDNETTPTYVGIPDNSSLCKQICALAEIEQLPLTSVLNARTETGGGWNLEVKHHGSEVIEPSSFKFDALVLAVHDPTLAARTVQSLVDQEAIATQNAKTDDDEAHLRLQNRLTDLISDLKGIRDARKPIFTWSGSFDDEDASKRLPYDAVSVPGSHLVQFIARESSKPLRNEGGIWTAVSTSHLAQDILQRHKKSTSTTTTTASVEEEAAAIMSQEISRLMFGKSQEVIGSSVRWGAAFSSTSLRSKGDSVLLHPWRLAIAGDFVRSLDAHPTPSEAAALSGLEAGERIASLFGDIATRT